MLGASVGAIAAGRVPVGNAAGNLITSWANPTSMLCGTLAVAAGAHLAAVYLAADATRLGEPQLERYFRARALTSGVLTGVIALIGLPVLHHSARHIYHGLLVGYGLAAVIVSAAAGLSALGLVWRWHFQFARAAAALAVAAILAGWAAAQRPTVLPGLTLQQAAAGRQTMIALILAVLGGGIIVGPSLGLLFRLALTGVFDPIHNGPRVMPPRDGSRAQPRLGRPARAAAASLVAGFILLTLSDADAAHAVGVLALIAAAVLAFQAVAPDQLPDA
jgi:cytochrome d ubiquinol oxidase subunit II